MKKSMKKISFNQIIIHPGGAHTDELVACALALGSVDHCVDILRKVPDEAELEDKNILVMDVGGRHEPEKLNFDHHHFGREDPVACAYTLLADHLEIAKFLEKTHWYKLGAVLDARGPFAAARTIGLKALPDGLDPFGDMLIRLLEKTSKLSADDPVTQILRVMGKEMIESAVGLTKAIEEARKISEEIQVGDLVGILTQSKDDEAINILRAEDYPEAIFQIAPDKRSAGLTLYRYDDDERLDFSQIENEDSVKFAHKQGFMAVLKEGVELDEALILISKSLK